MAYDLEEQEQLDELKAWWKQYGGLIIGAVIAALLTVGVIRGWHWYKQDQALGAVALYEQMEKAERAGDHKKVQEVAAQVTGKYGSTAYAMLAALASAKAAFLSGDLPASAAQLKWVVDNAREDEIKDLARLRLAGVLLDEKKHDEALKLLEVKPVEAMTGLYADLRGDVLAAQGKLAEAREAYQLALDKSEAGSAYRSMIQLKLDALGEAPPSAKS